MTVEAAYVRHEFVDDITQDIIKIVNFKPGDSVDDLIENGFCGKVEYLPLSQMLNNNSGRIEVKGEGDFIVRANSYDNTLRRRFTLAHELGHYILHSNMGKTPITVNRSGINERIEWEANWFAAGLLMPKNNFVEKYNENNNDYLLSGYFKVSLPAIKARISYLKKIGAIQ